LFGVVIFLPISLAISASVAGTILMGTPAADAARETPIKSAQAA
jgi:hypothetical protein